MHHPHQTEVPPRLASLNATPRGRAWLAALPARLGVVCDRWSLTLGRPYAESHLAYVAPAERADGAQLVVKVRFPHRESDLEGEALRRWDGDGAVRLVAEAPDVHALLVERCEPGVALATVPDVALPVLSDLVRRLAVPAGAPFGALADEAQRWREHLPRAWDRAGRPFERELVDRAVRVLAELAATQGPQVRVHQDLHGANVLAAQRRPWLAIDPKPLHGEIEFALAPVVRSRELGHGEAAVRHRLDFLTRTLQLDRDRAREWAFAQTLAWAFDGDRLLPGHLDTARWLLRA